MSNHQRRSILIIITSVCILSLGAAFIYVQGVLAESLLPESPIIQETYQPGSGLPVGKILSVRGDVLILHAKIENGFWAKIGLPLYEGDTIITLEKGAAVFRLSDGSRLTLLSNSKIRIDRCMFSSASKRSISYLDMALGEARFQVKLLAGFEPREFKVRTKTAVTHAQAADFIIRAGESSTEVSALKNTQLQLTSLAVPEKPMLLSDFQQIKIGQFDLAFSATEVKKEEVDKILMEFRPSLDNYVFGPGSARRGDVDESDDLIIETLGGDINL